MTIWYDWRFSYFSLDDFNNLFWVQRVSGWSMLWHVVDPLSDFFRPLGMSVYWILLHTAGLNAWPYHVLAWTLHALNVGLVYLLLVRIVGSPFAAAVGTLLFGFRANFGEIYWNFGFIFELLACFLMLLVLLIQTRERRSYLTISLALLLTILAIKAKEMAITLPALLIAYDFTQKRNPDRKTKFEYLGLAAITVWFIRLELSAMPTDSPEQPYHMDLTFLTAGRGYGWYGDHLSAFKLRWGAWITISALFFLCMLYRRERRGIFFLASVFISFLPVVFLVNHRGEFYWYIPFLGVAGLVAVMTDSISRRMQRWVPSAASTLGLIIFLTIAGMHYGRETQKLHEVVSLQRGLSKEYASFVRQLYELPQPAEGETIYFRSFPENFSSVNLLSVTQVALHRTDLKIDVVHEFPTSCRYCLDFEDGKLIRRNQ